MTSAFTVPLKKSSAPRTVAWAVLIVASLGLTGCLEDKKATAQTQEHNEQLMQQNKTLMKQLQEAKVTMDQQQQQLTTLQTELERLKAAQTTAARPTAPAQPANGQAAVPAPTGPAPKNLPYSLYTGVLTTRKGETLTLGSVNFGKIDRVPLVVNGADMEVGMDKIRYIRRMGQFDATKKQFPVSVELVDGQEVRAGLPVEHVKGVDPRFGTSVEIPIGNLIELQFLQPN